MLTKETENLVAKLFINLFEGEKSVELARKNLANSTDFDAYQIFQRLDRERKNFIDEYNLAEILRLLNNSFFLNFKLFISRLI